MKKQHVSPQERFYILALVLVIIGAAIFNWGMNRPVNPLGIEITHVIYDEGDRGQIQNLLYIGRCGPELAAYRPESGAEPISGGPTPSEPRKWERSFKDEAWVNDFDGPSLPLKTLQGEYSVSQIDWEGRKVLLQWRATNGFWNPSNWVDLEKFGGLPAKESVFRLVALRRHGQARYFPVTVGEPKAGGWRHTVLDLRPVSVPDGRTGS